MTAFGLGVGEGGTRTHAGPSVSSPARGDMEGCLTVRFPIRLALLVTSIIFLSACSAISGEHLMAHSGGGHAVLIERVPFYPQEDYQCGPASLAAVMNFWNVDVAPEDIAREIYSPSARGTLDVDLVLYARSKGLVASRYSGGLEDLRGAITSGYPLIVLVDYGSSLYQVNHFMVVVGYRDEGIIVNSGRQEGGVMPLNDFLNSWERTRFWTLRIGRP